MKVKDVIKYLEQCNPESDVFTGSDITDEYDIVAIMEINVSSQCSSGVYILGE